jgi:glycosidase
MRIQVANVHCKCLLPLLLLIIAGQISAFGQNIDFKGYPPQYGKPFEHVPDSRDVTMYQINMRVFSESGNFQGVTDRLEDIRNLGVNVIYLMPIYPIGTLKSVNSPYSIKDFDAINSEFGTLEDLRALVDKAHQLKMAVILDFVANHTSWDHPWLSNKSWYEADSTGRIKHPRNWRDVAQLNFNNADVRLALVRSMKSWVYRANIDGFRCDFADGPPTDFWKQALDTLDTLTDHKLLMLAEGTRPEHFALGFDYNFGFRFYGNLINIFGKNKSVKSIDELNERDYKGTVREGQEIIRYLSNHDVNGSGTPSELFGGKEGSMAAFVMLAYMKGIPMIYNGQEVATPVRLTFPFTSSKIDWSINPDVTAEYKKIISFRNQSQAVRRGKLTSYSSDDVCAFTKTMDDEKVLVISNFRNKEVYYTIPNQFNNSVWLDAYNGEHVRLNDNITLAPYSYLVLKN